MLGVLGKYCHVGCEYLHSVANSHCSHPTCKRIHPRFPPISQHQSQVGAVNGDDEARHSSTSSDIYYRSSDANKCVNELSRMRDDIGDWQCAKGAETLGCP
jgi:hypothetical protein